MIHIVNRIMSTRIPNLRYTMPGFGDAIHTILLAHLYGKAHNDQVTMHLDKDKYNKDKPGTLAQCISLFPKNTIFVEGHDKWFKGDIEFVDYITKLKGKCIGHYYKDFPNSHRVQKVVEPFFWADDYLNNGYPCLSAEDMSHEIKLPKKFITVQWDAGSKNRKLSGEQINEIHNSFKNKGCEIVVVGGEAQGKLRRSLKHIGYAMSKADYHVGVDSGYMHLAQLYFKPENIYIYTNKKGKWEHHLLRFHKNGSKVNEKFV